MGGIVSLFCKRPRAPPPQLNRVAEVLRREAEPPAPAQPPEKKEPGPQAQKEPPAQPPVQKQSPQENVVREAREKMGVDCINYYNFAVTGQSGVGKSSFVNGVLSLEGDHAAVGEVETTQQIRSYSCKKWPHLKLWDLPGAGTRKHPASTYFEDKKLYAFDAILVLSSDRFLEVDFKILQSARKFDTPCVFVRTKCDISVENKAKRDKVNALEASQRLRGDVSQSFHEGLANASLISSELKAPHLYFISNELLSPENEDTYSICDKKKKTMDFSLSSMDEQALITLLLDVAKRRA
ncbi:hypothetical protein L7F22_063245 [Adiantum nelumboides]|nr:hypothetical protein [Adiantum nelumboides]